MLTRRQFVRALAGAAAGLGLGSRAALAFGDGDKFQIASLVYNGGSWQPHPTALRRVLWEIDKRTSIDARLEPVEVRLASAELYRHPFLYLAGDRAFPAFAESDVVRLRRHLQAGGFLLVDSAEGHPGGGFDVSVRALVARLFPKEPLAALPDDHVVYKSFYLLKAPAGRVLAVPYLEAVIHDGRAALIYCQNDLGGAWSRDEFGQWEHEVFPGGDAQREQAFRLGINLAMYATCLDYKTDQVHVPFILRRRRWQAP
jgi:hypothetical protein